MSPRLLAAFMLADAAVMAGAAWWILRQRSSVAGIDFDQLRAFTEDMERRVETSLKAGWNGEPATLPDVLATLVSEVEHDAHDRGLPIEREWIKRAIARWIGAKRLVDPRTLGEAMRHVA